MVALYQPSNRVLQPQAYSRLNHANALTRGIVASWALNENLYDSASKTKSTSSNTEWVPKGKEIFLGIRKVSGTLGFNIDSSVPRLYNSLTVVASISIDSVTSSDDRYITSDWSASGRNYLFRVTTTGQADMLVGNGASLQDASVTSSVLSANTIYRVAFVVDGTTRTIYLNGKVAATGTGSYSGGVTSNTRCIATSGFNTYLDNLDGLINGVTFYNRALTPSELAEDASNHWQIFAPKQTFVYYSTSTNFTLQLTTKSLSLTKNSINLVKQSTLPIASVSKALTKNPVNLLYSKKIIETVASLSLYPKNNNLLLNRILTVDTKLVDLVVNPVNLTYSPASSYTLQITSKSLSLTKNNINLLISRLSQITTTNLILSKSPINLVTSRLLQVTTKTLALTASAVGLTKSSSGSYNLLVNRVQLNITKNNVFNLYGRIFPINSLAKDLITNDLFGSYGRFITVDNKVLSITKGEILYRLGRVLNLTNKTLSLTESSINLLYNKKIIVTPTNLDVISNNTNLLLGRKNIIDTKVFSLSKSTLYLKYSRLFGISNKILDLVIRDVILSQGLVSDQEIIESAVTIITGTSINLYDLSEYTNILISTQSKQVITLNN